MTPKFKIGDRVKVIGREIQTHTIFGINYCENGKFIYSTQKFGPYFPAVNFYEEDLLLESEYPEFCRQRNLSKAIELEKQIAELTQKAKELRSTL